MLKYSLQFRHTNNHRQSCKSSDLKTPSKVRQEKHLEANHVTIHEDKGKVNTDKHVIEKLEENNCKTCRLDFPTGKKKFKCEECECYFCEICAMESLVEEDWFMCFTCQR